MLRANIIVNSMLADWAGWEQNWVPGLATRETIGREHLDRLHLTQPDQCKWVAGLCSCPVLETLHAKNVAASKKLRVSEHFLSADETRLI